MVMEVESVWNLGGMGMLCCMRVGIGMRLCVLVLLVVVVLAVVLVWMVLMVWVVVGMLTVVVVTVIVQGVLVEVHYVGVVSGSSSGGFVVLVALEGFGLVAWSSCRMAFWCWNQRADFWEALV